MNQRQQAFLAAYLVSFNATESAIKAGFSTKTARQAGARMLTNDNIQEAIKAHQTAMQERTSITVERVLQELSAIAFADIADYLDFDGTTLKIKPLQDIPKEKRVAIAEISQTTTMAGVNTKLKFNSKQAALEAIGRHLGMNVSVQDLIDKMSDEQIEEITQKLLSKLKP